MGSGIYLSEDELEALARLRWRARLAYLYIREHMDFATGVAGVRTRVCYEGARQYLEPTERTTEPEKKLTERQWEGDRKALIRVGLIAEIHERSHAKRLFFRCCLARLDESVQNQDVGKWWLQAVGHDVAENASNIVALRPKGVGEAVRTQEPQEVGYSGVRLKTKNSLPNGSEGSQSASAEADDSDEPMRSRCPHEKIQELYREILGRWCPEVRSWGPERQRALRARWREYPDLDWWRGYFSYVAESKFLTGRAEPSKGRPPFVASLDWLIGPKNLARVYEGYYHR